MKKVQILSMAAALGYISAVKLKGQEYTNKFSVVQAQEQVQAKGKGKIVKYCCGRIHTNRDTVANVENIEFLTNSLTEYINNL